MSIGMQPAYCNLIEAAKYLRIGYRTAVRDWPAWKDKCKVRIGHYGKSLRIYRPHLDRIIEDSFYPAKEPQGGKNGQAGSDISKRAVHKTL